MSSPDAIELARLVQETRRPQTRYFKQGRTTADLETSKTLERQLDAAAAKILAGPSLFDGDDER